MGARPRMHHIATAAAWIMAVSCSSPTTPDVPLVADVSVAPPTKIAAIVGAPPFRWRASWTVSVQTAEVAGGGDVFASVRARVEHQDGRALAELAENRRPLGREAGIEGRIARFAQTAIYETPATPPTSSRLVITVQLSDRRGRVEEMTRVDAILEYLCGLKGQIGCEGATIELADAGASPRQVTIAFGQKVMYLSRHAGAHRISSDPHPAHTDCPSLNVGEIRPFLVGSTAPFLSAGTCRFHDDNDPANPALTGEIVVRPIASSQ